jgi:hypothetical protein
MSHTIEKERVTAIDSKQPLLVERNEVYAHFFGS